MLVSRLLKPVTYVLAAVYFLVDAVFMTLSGLDQIASTLPLARAVFCACRHLGTNQACGSLPRRDWPDLKWRSDIDHRRGSKARARGAPVQSHSGQVDEDPGIRLGLYQIPPSQSMDRSHGGLANHAVIEQGRA